MNTQLQLEVELEVQNINFCEVNDHEFSMPFGLGTLKHVPLKLQCCPQNQATNLNSSLQYDETPITGLAPNPIGIPAHDITSRTNNLKLQLDSTTSTPYNHNNQLNYIHHNNHQNVSLRTPYHPPTPNDPLRN